MPPPSVDEIKRASKDVAWEYVALLGAALEMAKAHESPISNLLQEAFLAHVRNLAEFFRGGIEAFKKANVAPERSQDNIYAVDFCRSVNWKPERFSYDKKLIQAINKTLSHMTYSRDRTSKTHVHFEGYLHLHGTVSLMRQTMDDFLKSVKPEFLQPRHPTDIRYWLDEHTKGWPKINSFGVLLWEFETRVNELVRQTEGRTRKWTLNQTPDGPVPF